MLQSWHYSFRNIFFLQNMPRRRRDVCGSWRCISQWGEHYRADADFAFRAASLNYCLLKIDNMKRSFLFYSFWFAVIANGLSGRIAADVAHASTRLRFSFQRKKNPICEKGHSPFAFGCRERCGACPIGCVLIGSVSRRPQKHSSKFVFLSLSLSLVDTLSYSEEEEEGDHMSVPGCRVWRGGKEYVHFSSARKSVRHHRSRINGVLLSWETVSTRSNTFSYTITATAFCIYYANEQLAGASSSARVVLQQPILVPVILGYCYIASVQYPAEKNCSKRAFIY